ncbi:MAG: hypothetical protein WBX17_06875 [Microbacterium sp.]
MAKRGLRSWMGSAFALAAVTFSLVSVAPAAQASEVGIQTASCGATQEMCYDYRSNWGGGWARVVTQTSNVSGGSAYWALRKGSASGTVICSGSMGYNDSRNCNTGSYTGTLVFQFAKGQNSLTTISIFQG